MSFKKNTLIKISLLGFLFCFLAIYFIEDKVQLEVMPISQMDNSYINKYVKIQGDVVKVSNSESTTYLTIKEVNDSINGVIFDKINVSKERYFFEGKIVRYNDGLEIIVEKYY